MIILCSLFSKNILVRGADMKKYIKDNWKWLSIGFFILFIIIPLLTQIFINIDTINKGSDDGWLGFWGGYLGAIIGIAGAIFVVQIQLKEDREGREVEKVDNTFFNLLTLHNDQKNTLNDDRIFEETYSDFNKELKNQLLEAGLDFFYSEKDTIVSILQEFIKGYKNYIENNEQYVSAEFLERWERRKTGATFSDSYTGTVDSTLYNNLCYALEEIASIEKFLDDVENKKINYFSHTVFEGAYEKLDNYTRNYKAYHFDVPEKWNQLIAALYKYKSGHLSLLPFNRKKRGIERAINNHYSRIGAYFRIFHRIVKYINDKVADEEIKKDYLGFLRATINEKEMLVIFYNAAYTERGNGLLKEIRKTTFFGEHNELLEDSTVQHFNPNSMLWKSEDLKIMQGFGNK